LQPKLKMGCFFGFFQFKNSSLKAIYGKSW